MTPEEERLAELLGRLGERHVATGADGAWLRPRLRQARFRRSMVAAAAAAVAVVAIAGGVAATSREPKAEPVPPATSPTPLPSATASPVAAAPVFVSAIGVRPNGSGAAIVGPCQLPGGSCDQTLRRTANGGKTLDASAQGQLPLGPPSSGAMHLVAASRFALYLWQSPGQLISWSIDNGNTWKEAGLDAQIADVDAAPDTDSVWVTTQLCPAMASSTGCELRLISGQVGQDPLRFATLELPVSRAMGPISVSRGSGGRAAVAVARPVTGGRPGSDGVFVTEDDGRTWTRQDLSCEQNFGTPIEVSLALDGAVWALCVGESSTGAERKQAYVAERLGEPFRLVGALPARGYAASIGAASSTTAWVSGDRGPVFATSDGGATWTAVTDDSDFFGPVQVLPDGTALAPGQVDGHGAVWMGSGGSRWTARAVRSAEQGDITDCNALKPGDDLDFGALHCDPDQQVQISTMDCSTGIYVRIVRPNVGDLEGITGFTPTWRAAEPIDPRYGRTPYTFHNCFEEEAGGAAFATASPTFASPDLWPADADGPVAGACGTAEGRYATVEANPDTPSPRCQVVQADQRLRVRNTTNAFNQPGQVITVQFAGYPTRRLAAGEETVFDRPMGEYLARGVHYLHLSVYGNSGGGELWLKS